MSKSEEQAFLSRVRDYPDDDGPRLIFADWLDEQGDPRGEFIRIQCAIARLPHDDPRRAELQQREQALFDSHQHEWTARLRGIASDWTYRRGFIESISIDAKAFLTSSSNLLRQTPIRRVRFIDAGSCFVQLVEAPMFGQIPEIDLTHNYLGNGCLNLLARATQLTRLESLHLGFNDITDQGLRLLAGIPHLSTLRELYLDDNRQIGTPGVRALADSPYLGRLRHLDLSGNNLSETALRVLINGDSLRQLDSLTLHNNKIGDAGVESLAHSELLKRMLCRSPVLDLSWNNIGPVGARFLAESPLVEPIETLNLANNVIGDAGLASLAQSPYLHRLKRLLIRENRISDSGVLALAHSRVPESLTFIDLKGNFVTTDSTRVLDESTIAIDWRKKIEVEIDPGLHLRTLPGR
jgi:uncharacterized protein (TIGR02996 family)